MTVTAILPSSIVSLSSRAARVWCVARSLNHPDNGATGSGLVKISMADFCYYLRRSPRSVWRYMKDALSKGYFYKCEFSEGIFTIEYRGLKSLTRHLGLEAIGPIGEVPLVKIQHAATFACDLVAEQTQGQSDFKRKKESENAKGQSTPYELLDDDSSSVRVPGEVITRGKRLLYLSSWWVPFGGCQKTIADRLGCSVRTVQNRVSNAWRNERGIPSIKKIQTAREVIEGCPGKFLDKLLAYEEDANRYVRLGRRLFKVGCNLYESPVETRSQRYRKRDYWRTYYNDSEETTKNRPRTQTLHRITSGGASNLSVKDLDFPEESGASPEVKFPKLAQL